MKVSIFASPVFFLLLLAGCQGVSTKNLKPLSGSPLFIKTDFKYVHMNTFHYTLKAGEYAPKYQSKSGKYYEGPGKCLTEEFDFIEPRTDQKKRANNGFRCGIFIANKAPNLPKVYFYFDPKLSSVDPAESGVLVAKLNEASIENIQVHSYQPNPEELAKAIAQ